MGRNEPLDLSPGKLYLIRYDCPSIEDQWERAGIFEGAWTGQVDSWGKRTYVQIGGGGPLYLFDHEVVEVEPLF